MHLLQSPEHHHSLDELDEEELQDAPPQPVRCGGEEGQGGGNASQTPRLHADRAGGSGRRRPGKAALTLSFHQVRERFVF